MGTPREFVASASAAELDNFPPVSLRRPACWHRFKLHGCLALGCRFQARFLAGFGFTIQRLRHGGRATDLAEQQDFHMKFAAIVGDPQHVTDADFACRLGRLAVGLNPAQLTRPRRESSRLEEACSPEPFVDSYGRHKILSYKTPAFGQRQLTTRPEARLFN